MRQDSIVTHLTHISLFFIQPTIQPVFYSQLWTNYDHPGWPHSYKQTDNSQITKVRRSITVYPSPLLLLYIL